MWRTWRVHVICNKIKHHTAPSWPSSPAHLEEVNGVVLVEPVPVGLRPLHELLCWWLSRPAAQGKLSPHRCAGTRRKEERREYGGGRRRGWGWRPPAG